jgi:hypothetical protein
LLFCVGTGSFDVRACNSMIVVCAIRFELESEGK